ncbi:hypothetical protein Hanom_Chr14g01293861 [Helianthus anomalus]
MRKNKPLDESSKTGQTSWTKMAFYSLNINIDCLKTQIQTPSKVRGLDRIYHVVIQEQKTANIM